MTAIGEKIASLRREANMTQADLGDALCVTAQAISKWERGQAEPDISTLLRISELFHVSMDELLKGDSTPAPEAPPAGAETAAHAVVAEGMAEPAPAPAPVQEKIKEAPVGNCAVCKQPVSPDEVGRRTPILLCNTCLHRKTPVGSCMKCGREVCPADLSTAPPIVICNRCKSTPHSNTASTRKKGDTDDPNQAEGTRKTGRASFFSKGRTDAQKARAAEAEEERQELSRGYIWGGIAGAVVLLCALLFLPEMSIPLRVLSSVLAGYAVFAAVAQCLWETYLLDVFEWFISRTVQFPGIIFSFDLDGLAFLIVMKLLFAALGFLFGVLMAVLGIGVCLVLGFVSFPFSLLAKHRAASGDA